MIASSGRIANGLSLAVVILALGVGNAVAEPGFQGLGVLPAASFSGARGISADGSTVVGTSGTEAFRWTSQTGMVPLGDPPGFRSATGVSSDGSVVVGSGDVSISGRQAFRWTSSTGVQQLGNFGGESVATGVSGDGSIIVGYSSTDVSDPIFQAFRWTSQTAMVGLGFLPGLNRSSAFGISADGSAIVGNSRVDPFYEEAFRWTSETGMVGLGRLFPSDSSVAAAASADGSVVVGSSGTDHPFGEAFYWTSETGMVGLGHLDGASSSDAYAVSGDGSIIVGGCSRCGYDSEAFIWDAANGIRNLEDVLQNDFGLDLAGWTLREATGISADGRTIAGSGISPAGQEEAWIAVLTDALSGDYNNNGFVDAADYVLWRKTGGSPDDYETWRAHFGESAGVTPGDFNGDGSVDAADYVVWRKSDGTQAGYDAWRAHFGQTAGSGSAEGSPGQTSVPEPTAAALMLLAGLLVAAAHGRRAVRQTSFKETIDRCRAAAAPVRNRLDRRNLARHPDTGEFAFQRVFDLRGELRDGEGLRGRFRWSGRHDIYRR